MTGPSEHHIFNPDEIPSREISDPAVLSKNPLVSVKMITYNHAPYISQAIEGVLQQKTNFPIELVIGEDCSTDGTREIVFEYQKKYPDIIRVITSDENVGMKKNSYRTMQACRGKYIAFCEGDDYWHYPYKLQKQVNCIRTIDNCVLVHSNYHLYFAQTGKIRKLALTISPSWKDDNAYEEILTGKRNVLTLTVLADYSIVKKVVIENPECTDPKYLLGDLQLWLELARHGRVKCLPESLATHYMLPESATHSKNPHRELEFALSVRDLIYHYVKKYPCSQEVTLIAKSWTCLFALRKAWKASDRVLAKNLYREFCRTKNKFSPHALLLYYGSYSQFTRITSKPLIATYLYARSKFKALSSFWG